MRGGAPCIRSGKGIYAMINLVLSLAIGFSVAIAIRLTGLPLIAGIIPGSIATFAALFLLGRRVFNKLQAVNAQVQNELASLSGNPREHKAKVDKVVKLLEAALPLGKWQFMVEQEIWGQIGIIRYVFKDLAGAEAAFEKSSPRNYLAKAMQAAMFHNRKEFERSVMAFEAAVKAGKKTSLVWAAYAWCLMQNKEKDKAIAVLARAVQANPSDEKLKGALTALQNDKKLKMKAWEPEWWQLGLENPPIPQPVFSGGGRQMRFARR
jgi:tetratricopeptide (TPR) repeat protein